MKELTKPYKESLDRLIKVAEETLPQQCKRMGDNQRTELIEVGKLAGYYHRAGYDVMDYAIKINHLRNKQALFNYQNRDEDGWNYR